MPLRNTPDGFGAVAKIFHWATLLLLVGSFTLAVSMESLPLGPRKLQLFAWHKWVGVTVFLVVLLRLAWRLANPVPRQPEGVVQWQRRLAGLSHAALYGVLIVMPLTGWIMSAALNLPVVYLGTHSHSEPVWGRSGTGRGDEDGAPDTGADAACAGEHSYAGGALPSLHPP